MKFKRANRIAPDGTPRFAASHLGKFCVPMSHKKDAKLIWVKTSTFYDTHMVFYIAIFRDITVD